MISTELIYTEQLPQPEDIASFPIFIYDRYLLRFPQIKKWLLNLPYTYAVDAGEGLKQIKSFEKHTLHILKLYEQMKVKNITFVGIGGGSIGDFVGFLASVFKRGVDLVHIPSTWLAAIDSAHGGKTALNLGSYKNQIGTFYSATRVILSKQLLFTQSKERAQDAMGEVIKTALLSGGSLWRDISLEHHFSPQILWNYLPRLIAYKYKIVKLDPFEKKGLRYILNLGHTLGHTFELHYKISHGWSVNLGLRIALELSAMNKMMTPQALKILYNTPLLKNSLAQAEDLKVYLKNKKKIAAFLLQDKKISKNNNLHYIFLKAPGKPIVKEIDISILLQDLDAISL